MVAIKQIQNVTEGNLQEFVQEAELMKSIRPHTNVVQFLGICEDPFLIVTGNGFLFCTNVRRIYGTWKSVSLFEDIRRKANGIRRSVRTSERHSFWNVSFGF